MNPFCLSIISKYLNSSFDMLTMKKLSKHAFDYIDDKYIFHNDNIFICNLNEVDFDSITTIKHERIYVFNQFDINEFYKLLLHVSINTTI